MIWLWIALYLFCGWLTIGLMAFTTWGVEGEPLKAPKEEDCFDVVMTWLLWPGPAIVCILVGVPALIWRNLRAKKIAKTFCDFVAWSWRLK